MEENRQETEQEQEEVTEQVPEWKNRARFVIYPMAGIYIISLAHSMYKQIAVTSGNEQMIMITFTILFLVLGLALIIFGFAEGYKHSKRKRQQEMDKIEKHSDKNE